MHLTLSPLVILFASGFLVALVAIASILLNDQKVGSAALAAALAAGFAAYTAGTIYAEGLLVVLTNQTSNLWGGAGLVGFAYRHHHRPVPDRSACAGAGHEPAAVDSVCGCHRQHRPACHGGATVLA